MSEKSAERKTLDGIARDISILINASRSVLAEDPTIRIIYDYNGGRSRAVSVQVVTQSHASDIIKL